MPADQRSLSAQITSGTIQVGTGSAISGSFAIAGSSGFSFSAGFDSGTSEALCQPCRAGDTLSLSTNISPSYFGTARYRGQTYTFDFGFGGGWFSLIGPSFTLPEGDSPAETLVEFTTPFTTGDDTYLFLQSGANGENMHNLRLSGGGTATLRLLRFYDEVEGYLYFFDSLRFEYDKNQTPRAEKP